MCIRDSADREAGGAAMMPSLPAMLAVMAAAALICRMAGYCLLYTSDAADERSSVDLGGRRIIKKKKPLELCREDD